MGMLKRIQRHIGTLLILALLLTGVSLFGQGVETDAEFRSGVELQYKLNKQIRLQVEPEFRWSGDQWLNEYHLNLGGRYRPVDFLSLYARYRLIGEINDDRTTSIVGRYKVGLGLSKKVDRFDPDFRFSYSNYSDDQTLSGQFFQYTSSLAYDIKGFKLTPEASFSVYQNLVQYDIVKYRSSLELVYKISKDVSVVGEYAFDYFMLRTLNRHIFTLGVEMDLN